MSLVPLQELQAQNAKQLAVIRELSQSLEDGASELRAELEAEKQAIRQKAELEVQNFRRQRADQEVSIFLRKLDENCLLAVRVGRPVPAAASFFFAFAPRDFGDQGCLVENAKIQNDGCSSEGL